MEKEIEIIADDGNKIECNLIEKIEVVRQEVEQIEEEISNIEQEISEKNAKLEELKAKVEFAKKIIAMADEKKEKEANELLEQEV